MKKTWKKITAVAAGSVLLGASLMGATAALQDFPTPFVGADGTPDVQFVIGSGSTDDYLGVIDIATSLQAQSVVDVPGVGGSTEVSVEGGVRVAQSGKDLLLGVGLNETKDRLTRSDLPDLLRDGTLRIDSKNRDFSYDQEILLGGVSVKFGTDATDLDDPALYLETDDAVWTYVLNFRQDVDFTAANDSESFEMLGKMFTIDPNINAGGNIILFGSEETTLLQLNQPQTLTSDGQSYTLEVVGGNTAGTGTVVLEVNGVRRTVSSQDSVTIAGLEVYVKDIFVTDIPSLDASANVFVGSQKIELQPAANASTASFDSVEVNGRSVNGVEAKVVASNDNADISEIHFQFSPRDLSGDVEGFDEVNFLLAGESVADPVFGTVEVRFEGPNMALDSSSKAHVRFAQSGRNMELTYTGQDGNTITFSPYALLSNNNVTLKADENNGRGYVGLVENGTHIARDQIFILQEGAGSVVTTKLYESRGTIVRDGVKFAQLRDLGTGQTIEVQEGRQVGSALFDKSAPITVEEVYHAARNFTLSHNTSTMIYVAGGLHWINLSDDGSNPTVAVTVHEATGAQARDQVDDNDAVVFLANISQDGSNNRVAVDLSNASGSISSGTSDDGDTAMHLSPYGTYAVADVRDSRFAELWIPRDRNQELKLNVFVNPVGAQVRTVGGSGAQQVQRIPVGAAVRDTDVNVNAPSRNLIVVGGPCINVAAAELLELPAGSCGDASGLSPNEAMIQLFDLSNGKVAMLVAGWEAVDTQAAARAVATGDSRLQGDSARLTVTSVSNYQIQ